MKGLTQAMTKIGGFDNNSEVGLYFINNGKITEMEIFLKQPIFSVPCRLH